MLMLLPQLSVRCYREGRQGDRQASHAHDQAGSHGVAASHVNLPANMYCQRMIAGTMAHSSRERCVIELSYVIASRRRR